MTERPTATLDAVRRSHERLMATVAGIDDDTARRPSLLPGWDVAMLVTHLARNADSHTWASEGARVGESRRRYPSMEARDEGIEAGRGRSAADLVADLGAAQDRLERCWATLPDEAWRVDAVSRHGDREPVAELPRFRRMECEIHHVDLGLGFTFEDWEEDFVTCELDVWVPELGARLPPGTSAVVSAPDLDRSWTVGGPASETLRVDAPSRALLGWITGRRVEGLPEIGPWRW